MITNQSQAVVARHDYLPFAEEVFNGTAGRSGNFGAISNVTQGFTGQEADGGTATLHFFNARHMSGVLGTFVQPDPANAGADITRPQSWNAYGYVLGNPLGAVDPSGTTDCAPWSGCQYYNNRDNGYGGYGGGDGYSGVTGGDCFSASRSEPCGGFPGGDGGVTFGFGGGSGGTTSIGATIYDTGAIFRSVSFLLLLGHGQAASDACSHKIEQSVLINLKPTKFLNLGPTQGNGMSQDGMRGGAYNRDFFAAGVPFGSADSRTAVPGTICGRFADGLHIPIPNAPGCPNLNDPTVFTGMPTIYKGLSGFKFSAHIDSGDANTSKGSAKHLVIDVFLGNLGYHHGC